MTLQIGDIAPDFTLADANGNSVSLSDFRGSRVILYFYPRDNTPGCTKEACSFRDTYPDYQSHNIVILGVSNDDAKSHQKFIRKHQLPFPLLCDLEGTVATLYGSYGFQKFMGKEYMGVYRHTFAIAPDGKIEKIYRKVKPETHGADILQELIGS